MNPLHRETLHYISLLQGSNDLKRSYNILFSLGFKFTFTESDEKYISSCRLSSDWSVVVFTSCWFNRKLSLMKQDVDHLTHEQLVPAGLWVTLTNRKSL